MVSLCNAGLECTPTKKQDCFKAAVALTTAVEVQIPALVIQTESSENRLYVIN